MKQEGKPAEKVICTRACLKKAFCKMCVTICGRFCPDEGAVAGYGNRIRAKYTAKWGVQIVGMIFQTRSNTTKNEAGICKKFYMPASLFYRFVYSFTLLYCPFPENLYSPLRMYQNRLLCRLFQMYCHRTLLCSHLAYLLNLI